MIEKFMLSLVFPFSCGLNPSSAVFHVYIVRHFVESDIKAALEIHTSEFEASHKSFFVISE